MSGVRLSLLALLLVLPQRALAGAYHGKVVDAGTGEPLGDAVAVVWWVKKPLVSMDGPEYFHDVKETVTDGAGEFSVDSGRRVDLNPFTYVRKPRFAVFKPGYQPLAPGFAATKDFKGFDDLRAQLQRGAVIRLVKLRREQDDSRKREAGLVTTPGDLSLGPDMPADRIPNVFRLINVERRRLGLDPIGGR